MATTEGAAELMVLSAVVAASNKLDWRITTPPILPAIDVIPEPVAPNQPLAQLLVRLTYPDQPAPEQLPEQVGVFPVGQMAGYQAAPWAGQYSVGWISAPQDVPALDGHVLLRWQDGSLLISSFSQGGKACPLANYRTSVLGFQSVAGGLR